MAVNQYHFITQWRFQATIFEVADVFKQPETMVRWWPSVYLDVRIVEEGEPSGLHKVLDLTTKGWLPYTLRWRLKVTEIDYPHRLGLAASGDFNGRGLWTLVQNGEWAEVTYDWRVEADKPLLKYGSLFVRPIFAANHRWAMAKGEESLRLELLRRQAATPDELARIPAPPAPTFVKRS